MADSRTKSMSAVLISSIYKHPYWPPRASLPWLSHPFSQTDTRLGKPEWHSGQSDIHLQKSSVFLSSGSPHLPIWLFFCNRKAERIISQLAELLRLSSYAIEKAAAWAASSKCLGIYHGESEQQDSNRRHHGYKPCVLPTELCSRGSVGIEPTSRIAAAPLRSCMPVKHNFLSSS